MSVFTKVSHAELVDFLKLYPLGELIGYQGIGEGVENTNYFVDTTDGRWVLTLFERLNPDDLPFFLGLMSHLASRGIPCPMPVVANDGRALQHLNGKPAAIVQRLNGNNELFPNVQQCRAVGEHLAEMHLAGSSFTLRADNTRGRAWRQATGAAVMPRVAPEVAEEIRLELAAHDTVDLAALPQGVVHADLFRDNVLLIEDRISGFIDFYYACNDALLYDLAVTVNDWCTEPDGHPNKARFTAMTEAYRAIRDLTPAEEAAWPMVLRIAATRFWLSRLYDWVFPREGDLVHVKDPEQYHRILVCYREGGVIPV